MGRPHRVMPRSAGTSLGPCFSSSSLCLCAENATPSMKPPLISQARQISPGWACVHTACCFPLSRGPQLSLLTCVSLIGGKLCGGRNTVSLTFVKSPGAGVVAATVLKLMNIWQVIECMLWVKPQSVLPESQDTQLACRKLSLRAKSLWKETHPAVLCWLLRANQM